MEKKQNNRFLLTQWLITLVLGVILIFLLIRLIQLGYSWVVVLVIAFMVVVVLSSFGNFQINRLLQADSPQPLINYYEKRFGRQSTPLNKIFLAFCKALCYTLYGLFDSARAEVEKIDWEQKPPIFQAQNVYLQALWAYLEKHDFQQGTILAKEARQLAEVSSAFPGASRSLSSYDAIVEIGELLSGNANPTLVARLREKLRRLPVLVKVFIAWGLERFYDHSGDVEQAQEMRDLLTKLAPHCKGLSPYVETAG
ncbi:MAG: hypothetical protein ABIU05_12725 [Nitrospirales bacterium]